MILNTVAFASPRENVFYDEALLRAAHQTGGEDVLRLWESKDVFIVLGRTGLLDDEVCLPRVLSDRIPVVRRSSGGGTVLQGPGCLNFSLILSKRDDQRLNNLHACYLLILGRVISLLQGLGREVRFQPVSDLALVETDRKVSGNAQRRARDHILHHGTLLVDFDLDRVGWYLAEPALRPAYRGRRNHAEFLANLSLEKTALERAFRDEFSVRGTQAAAGPVDKKILENLLHAGKAC